MNKIPLLAGLLRWVAELKFGPYGYGLMAELKFGPTTAHTTAAMQLTSAGYDGCADDWMAWRTALSRS